MQEGGGRGGETRYGGRDGNIPLVFLFSSPALGSLAPSLCRVPLKVFGERSKWSSRWAPPSPAHVTLCLEVSEFVLAAANRRHL